MTSIAVLTTIEQAVSWSQQWDRLSAEGASMIFTSPAWCLAAWRTLPDLGSPLIVAAIDDSDSLLGLLSLTSREGMLHWAGSPLGDEHDARIRSDQPAVEVVSLLVQALRLQCLSTSALRLSNVRPNGALSRVIAGRPACPAPVLKLADPDPDFGALGCIPGWSHDRRRGLRSARKRLSELGHVTFEWVTDPHALAVGLPPFVAARLHAWGHRGRLHELPAVDRHPCFPAFLVEAGRELGSQGRCVLARLCLDGEPVAQSVLLRAPTADLLYMSTYRPEMARYSPSHLLLAEVAGRAVGEGVRIIEMGRGDEPYKFDLGATQRHLHELVLAT